MVSTATPTDSETGIAPAQPSVQLVASAPLPVAIPDGARIRERAARRRRIAAISLWIAVIAIGAAVALYFWKQHRVPPLPPGIAMSNGRVEATEIDVASKLPGRIKDVLAQEGDFVEAGQVVALMDTQTLDAELRQTQAQVRQAQNAINTATAVVDQRESELAFAEHELRRSEDLLARGFVSRQKVDSDRTHMLTARAALIASRSLVTEAKSALEAAHAAAERVSSDIRDSTLTAPRSGRVQYRLAQPGEVLPAGGKVLTMLDISDVYMTLFLPETLVGRIAIGAQARIVLDAAPQYVIPAKVSYVASEAQFTPKTVETASERQKLAFRIKAQIDPELLKKYRTQVKTGLPGVAYVRFDSRVEWPAALQPRLPQ
jgi:HlyD family secretion protein